METSIKNNKSKMGFFAVTVMMLLVLITAVNCGGKAGTGKAMNKDIEAYWAKTYPGQKILSITQEGEPFRMKVVIDNVERMRHEVNVTVEVEKKSGKKSYKMSANYLGDAKGKNLEFQGMGVR